ncbi:MAG: histidinol-phosphate aminotransferase family protein [Gemmatimonadales bacterium]|nr:MAG: histidinol-phosphate aminotransferase family protein [Gemmatimonadales bacterium]
MSPFPREAYLPLTPYAPDRRPIEIDLSDNTNRWGAHPDALAVVREADPDELIRYPSVYADALRDAIARRHGVPGSAVATGCGSDDLLDSGFRAICEPGERVAFIPPTFSMIEIFAQMNALEAVPVGDGVGSLPTPAELIEAVGGPGSRGLIYLCRPNNPTGEVQPRAWVDALIDEVGPRGPVIFIDEAYADYADESFLERAAGSERVVVLRTLSKVYGLAGLRVGFAVGAPQVIAEIEKSRGPYKVNRLAERAAVAALDDADGWIPTIVRQTREERAYLMQALTDRGLRPLDSGANFILVPLADGQDTHTVTAGLREGGVAVRPFPALPGLGDCIRVSIGPREELDRFLAELDPILDPSQTGTNR